MSIAPIVGYVQRISDLQSGFIVPWKLASDNFASAFNRGSKFLRKTDHFIACKNFRASPNRACNLNCGKDFLPAIAPKSPLLGRAMGVLIAQWWTCATDLPDVSKCFRRDRSKHPCQRPPCYFAWGCFRYFSWKREPGLTRARHEPAIGATKSTRLVGLRRSLASSRPQRRQPRISIVKHIRLIICDFNKRYAANNGVKANQD